MASFNLSRNNLLFDGGVPPLQCLALTRVAISIYNNAEVRNHELSLELKFYQETDPNNWEPLPLSYELNLYLENFRETMSDTVRKFDLDPDELSNRNMHAAIHWITTGSIDRCKTVQTLISNNAVTIQVRFCISSHLLHDQRNFITLETDAYCYAR
ncbi:hypothetical protein CEXT_437101 [Caerostris extrusa]|uniref:Uncharacterized protein n=1 Tax=Caerostris extrusa TaxID=172846 RepID=A0AAV4V1L0_CAEEX|nr:hypothetical protein CEXT_437101 [Caerostris extrusa]